MAWESVCQHSNLPVVYAAQGSVIYGYHVGRSFTEEAFTPLKVLTRETSGDIQGLVFDPEEGTLVVNVRPNILVLDAVTGAVVDQQEHDDLLLIDIVPSQRLLVTTGGGRLRTWRIVTGGRLQPLSSFGGLDTRCLTASCVDGHNVKVLVGCGDGVLRTWHVKKTGELEEPLDATKLPHFSGFGVMCVWLRWQELLVVTGSQDSLCSWRVTPSGALELLQEVEGAHEGGVNRVCYDEASRLHFTLGMDHNVCTWRIAASGDVQKLQAFKPPCEKVFYMHMLTEPRRLLTSSIQDGGVLVWAIQEFGDLTLVGEDRKLKNDVNCVYLDSSIQFLVAGYASGCLRTWGLESSGKMKMLSVKESAHPSSVLGGRRCGTKCMDLVRPQRLLLTGGGDAALRSWCIDMFGSFNLLAEVKDAHGKCVNCMCYIETKQLLVTGGFDKHVRTWTVTDGTGIFTPLDNVQDHTGGYYGTEAIQYVPAKQILVTGGGGDDVRTWHINQADGGGKLELLQAIKHGHEYVIDYISSFSAQISGKSSEPVVLTGGSQGSHAHVSMWGIGNNGSFEKMTDVDTIRHPCLYVPRSQAAIPFVINGGSGCTAWQQQPSGNFESIWFPRVSPTSINSICAGSWGSFGDFLLVGTRNGHLFGLSLTALLKHGVVRVVETDRGVMAAVQAWWFPILNYGVAAANSAVVFVQLLSFGFSTARPPELKKPAERLATFRDWGFNGIPYSVAFTATVVAVIFMVLFVGVSQRMKRWAMLHPDKKLIGCMFLAMSASTETCAKAGFLPILRPLLRSSACLDGVLQVDQSVQCGSVTHLVHWVLPGWVSAALLCFQAARLVRVDYALPKLRSGRHAFDWRADIIAQKGKTRTHPLITKSSSYDARALLGKLVLTIASIYVPTFSLSGDQSELFLAVVVFAVGLSLLRSSWALDHFFDPDAGAASLALPWGLQANSLNTMAASGVMWVSSVQLAAAITMCIRGRSALEHPVFLVLPAMIPLPMALGYFAHTRKKSCARRRVVDGDYQALP